MTKRSVSNRAARMRGQSRAGFHRPGNKCCRRMSTGRSPFGELEASAPPPEGSYRGGGPLTDT